jgi:hypothetical protein
MIDYCQLASFKGKEFHFCEMFKIWEICAENRGVIRDSRFRTVGIGFKPFSGFGDCMLDQGEVLI